ncbi:MAG: hypothetical protein WC192_00765 [Candidatus Babeliales bacterium]|jgi:uncharacterized protein YqgC (DUF456 family)
MKQNNWFQEIISELNGFVHLVFGIIFIIIGVVGLFLPIIPGVLLILLGLFLIGGRKLVHKIKCFITKKK